MTTATTTALAADFVMLRGLSFKNLTLRKPVHIRPEHVVSVVDVIIEDTEYETAVCPFCAAAAYDDLAPACIVTTVNDRHLVMGWAEEVIEALRTGDTSRIDHEHEEGQFRAQSIIRRCFQRFSRDGTLVCAGPDNREESMRRVNEHHREYALAHPEDETW